MALRDIVLQVKEAIDRDLYSYEHGEWLEECVMCEGTGEDLLGNGDCYACDGEGMVPHECP